MVARISTDIKIMKTELFALILSLVCISACYNANETGDSKTTKRIEKTSPTAEKSSTPEATPTQSAGNFSQAKSDYDAKNYEKAAAGFQDVVKADAKNLEAQFYLGKSFQSRPKRI
jgi:TolA-binding protein